MLKQTEIFARADIKCSNAKQIWVNANQVQDFSKPNNSASKSNLNPKPLLIFLISLTVLIRDQIEQFQKFLDLTGISPKA